MEGTGDLCAKRKPSPTNYVWCVCCYVGFRGKKGMKVKEGLYVTWEGGGAEVRLIGGVNRIKVCYMNAWKYHKETLYFVQLVCIIEKWHFRKPEVVIVSCSNAVACLYFYEWICTLYADKEITKMAKKTSVVTKAHRPWLTLNMIIFMHSSPQLFYAPIARHTYPVLLDPLSLNHY